MNSRIAHQAEVPLELAGKRLDQVAAFLFPDYSRARLQSWIKSGDLLLNSAKARARDCVKSGDLLVIDAELAAVEDWVAEPLPLDIVFEDEHLLVLNKAAGLVVHPAAGHAGGTLLNGLLHHCPELERLPRGGIVHRLDKDTTGLLVVAKSLPAHTSLVQQLQARMITREYSAIVQGVLTGGGTVSAPLGRHPVQRIKRAVVETGQEAVSHYRVITRFRHHTHVQVSLETGRTHQIRVHMAHLQYPIVGDPLYGGRRQLPPACSEALANALKAMQRQALHAERLQLVHPISADRLSWEAVLPEDMQCLLEALAFDAESSCSE